MIESAYDVACKSENPQKIVEDLKAYYYRFGGYGDQQQELEFIKRFLGQVFKNHPQLEAFEWHQYQDYNDNYMSFDLQSFKVNNNYELSVSGLDWFDETDWNFMFYNLNQEEEFCEDKDSEFETDWRLWEQYDAEIQKKCEPLRAPINLIIGFLKSLYDFYKAYYFIYVFGRRAKVEVTQKGIHIDHHNINYEDDKANDFYIKPE